MHMRANVLDSSLVSVVYSLVTDVDLGVHKQFEERRK
jgi:hypothetical protein